MERPRTPGADEERRAERQYEHRSESGSNDCAGDRPILPNGLAIIDGLALRVYARYSRSPRAVATASTAAQSAKLARFVSTLIKARIPPHLIPPRRTP